MRPRLPLLLLLLTLLSAIAARAATVSVSPGQRLADALRQVREWRRLHDPRCQDTIVISLKAGRHYMDEPLRLRPEDSGTPSSPLVIRGEEGAVVCADPRQQHRQLWPLQGMEPLLAFDTRRRTVTIARPPRKVLRQLLSQSSLEMVVHQRWAVAILRVQALTVMGDSVVATFREPESRLEFEHPWPQPVIGGPRGSSSFLLRTTEQRQGREQLILVEGTPSQPVSNVRFEHLTFEHTCWNRPLSQGHVTLQGGFPLVDAYKLAHPGLPWDAELENQAWVERPVSAVAVRWGRQIAFSHCTFRHLGATALDLERISEGVVEDCTFHDIGGTALMAGSFAEWPREVHRPYADLAGSCERLVIRRNTITDAGTEDWGAVAVGCGYVSHVTIDSNTVSRVPYSAICVGWGWTPKHTGAGNVHITRNHVTDYARQLYDAGGIYTLSCQPLSTIADNYVGPPAVAPYATNDRAFRVYLDAHTDGFTLSGNTTDDGRPIRRDEIGDNQPGPHLQFR